MKCVRTAPWSHPSFTKVSALTLSSEDLSSLGLGSGEGEGEGWLNEPSLLTSLSPNTYALALAHLSTPLVLVLTRWSNVRGYAVVSRIGVALGESEGSLADIEWAPDGRDGDDDVLAVGTTLGYLLLYSLRGQLIHKQSVYPARILSLTYRERTDKHGSFQDTPGSNELSVVFPGVIARFDASHIQAMLQKWFYEAPMRSYERRFQEDNDKDHETSFSKVPFQLWNVKEFGSCADAAIVGLTPPPLFELQSSQRHYCAVTIGEDSVISAYRLSEDRSRSLVGAILSKVGTATISTITSFSSILWRREPSPTNKAGPKPQSFAKVPLTCVNDPPRKGERLTLSPSGTLAAVTDSLGRILLLDTQALVVVRLWKGYRDAHGLFVEMLVKKENYYGSIRRRDLCLCLAIHAPHKGIIEIWQMRTGSRLLTIQCPKGSKMLQPSIRCSDTLAYNPLEVLLLNGDSGQLFLLDRFRLNNRVELS